MRRYDYDWLRVIGMLAVFAFHNGRFFNFGDWHVKNPQLSAGFEMLVGFLGIWIMPLMFIVSGAASYWALGRTAGSFFRSRTLRLFVPLVFGIFAFGIPQVYLERLTHSQFKGSLVDFIPHYFDGWYGFGGNFAWMGLHLWYLEMLFIYSLLLLPVFLYLRGDGGRKLLAGLAGFFEVPGAIFLVALPAVLLEASLGPSEAGIRDFGGWTIWVYLLLFLYGYVLVANPRIEAAVYRQGYAALILAVAATIGYGLASPPGSRLIPGTVGFMLAYGIRSFASWCWLLAFLGLGRRLLSFDNRFLAYVNEAVLPFYVLHQPVILTVGYFLLAWQVPPIAKYPVLALVSFVVIMAIYELLVRRIAILRFLFGLKRIQPAAPDLAHALRSPHP